MQRLTSMLVIPVVCAIVIAAALAFGIRMGSTGTTAKYEALLAKQASQAAQAAAKAVQQERKLQSIVNEAEKNALQREQTIRRLAGTTAGASDELRGAIAAVRDALPTAAIDAIRAAASTNGELLAECEGRRREVAAEAEILNSEKRELIEAWPRETGE